MNATTVRQSVNRYRSDINGIRAIAVILVVAYHAVPRLAPGGFVGVDVFFVISGYLITGNILRDIDSGTFTFLDFYARRCRRIIPALAILLAVVWTLGWYALLADEFLSLGRHIVAGATFTTNLVLWKEAGYFDAAAEAKPLLHLWSLGIEEQFYLMWPLFLVLVSRMRFGRFSAIMAVLIGSFALNAGMVSMHSITVFYLLPFRLWELLIGAALADIENRKEMAARLTSGLTNNVTRLAAHVISSNAVAITAAGALVLSAYVVNNRSPFPGWWAALPTIATMALLVVGRDAWLSQVVLASPPLVFIGLISYPLYLWHWPLLSIARIIANGEPPVAVRATLVLIAAALSWLTWRFVERPFKMVCLRSTARVG